MKLFQEVKMKEKIRNGTSLIGAIALAIVLAMGFVASEASAAYTYTASPSSTSNGGSTYQGSPNYLKMSVSVSSSQATFTVTKTDGGNFTHDGDLYLKVCNSCAGIDSATARLDINGNPVKTSVSQGASDVKITDDLGRWPFSNSSTADFYVLEQVQEESGIQKIWVGPITITRKEVTNEAPKVSITACPSSVLTTSSYTFKWSGTDTDGSVSEYYYGLDDSTPDVRIPASLSIPSYTWTGLSSGSHTFYVKARDNSGAESAVASCAFNVNSPANKPPTVSFRNCPTSVVKDSSYTFEWIGTDPDGYIAQYYYELDDPTPDIPTDGTSYKWTSLNTGSHTFYVKARDNSGADPYIAACRFDVDRSGTEEGIPIPQFKIGGIPSQMVWHGTALQFRVYCEFSAAVFSKTVKGSPLGKIVFDTSTGLFTYTPADTDTVQFFVEFTGTCGGELVSQEVEINPMPHLPPEQTVFGIDSKTYPDAEYMDYVVRSDVKSDTAESFNNVSRNTRSVSISGKTLVFQKDFGKNTLYNDYNNNEDIKEFRLFAETVIIRNPLNLPQTNVTIYARELRFEDVGTEKACINTTPKSLTTRPAGTTGTAGSHGLPAGNVTLHLEKFSAVGTDKRFILNGGNGQAGGLGKDGAAGTTMQVIPNFTVPIVGIIGPIGTTINGVYYSPVYYHDKQQQDCGPFWGGDWKTNVQGEKIWPGDGINAIPGGKPGNAGNGGNFSSNIGSLASFVGQSGGKADEKLPDYKGGAAGEPIYSAWETYYKACSQKAQREIIGTHISKKGNDAASPSADIAVGKAGTVSSVGSTMTWFTPFALKAVLAHAKDAYLQGHLDKIEGQAHDHKEVREILEDYLKQVDDCKSSAAWTNLSDTEQYEFLQLKGEMEILLHRIYTNLDYFCNPAGWTPMLSFEVTATMFENEVDRAIRVLYLTYWLGNKASTLQAKMSGLENAKEQMKGEITSFQARYTELNDNVLPGLTTEAENIANEISYLQSELQILEQKLLAEAKDNTKVDMWRQATQILGTICTVCPIGQPILGAVGTGLNMVANYDPNKPVDVTQLWDLAKQFSGENFTKSAKSFNEECKKLDFKTVNEHNGVMTYAENLNKLISPMVSGFNKVTAEIEENKAQKSEIEAEFERLKANCPEYQELIEKIRNLMAKKEAFALQINNAMQETMALSNGVIHDLLAIDGLNYQLTEGNAVIDQRAVVYLKEMEKRARERLLRYHYYMKKAYEYRMLEAYPGELNLTSMFDKFKTLASSDALNNGTLTPTDFDALKALYEEQLSTVIDSIYKKYVANQPTKSVPVRFELDQERIDQLNNNKMLILNLKDMGIFQPSEENIRIVEFKVHDIQVEKKARSFAYLDLYMTHSGISKLVKNGQTYLFRNYNNDTEHPIEWGVRYDYKYNTVNQIKPSLADASLLKYLMGKRGIGTSDEDFLLYSRPAAWADIVVTKAVNTDEASDLLIKKLDFEVQYDFVRRPDTMRKLEVQLSDENAKPYISVSSSDKNGRRDGMGEFQRIYSVNQSVTLTAPAQYGTLDFQDWIDSKGNVLGTDRILNVSLSDDKVVKARYISVEPVSYAWYEGAWNACNNTCTQTRVVECRDSNNNAAAESKCTDPKPALTQPCSDYAGCNESYAWYEGKWGACVDSLQTRAVECRDSNNNVAAESNCTAPKPALTQSCEPPDVRVTMDDLDAAPGSTDVPLVISLENLTKDAASVGFTIRYDSDSGIHCTDTYEFTSRTEGFSCSLTTVENGADSEVKVLLYNLSGEVITAGTGPILELFFDVDEDASLPSELSFKACIVSDLSGEAISADYTDTAELSPCSEGDMNCDGKVNILDLQAMINCILGKGDCAGCDLNGDGENNILDVQKLINKILNRTRTTRDVPRDSLSILTLPDVRPGQDETGVFGLDLENEDAVGAMQISFVYDSAIGFSITGAKLTDRSAGFDSPAFQVNSSDPKNVEVTVLLYSMAGKTIDPGTGDILEFGYDTVSNAWGTGGLEFKEAVLSDKDANPLNTESVNGTVAIVKKPGYDSDPEPGAVVTLGSVNVGASLSSTLSISETGNTELKVTSIALSGANAGDFSVTPATLSIPDGGEAQNLTVQCRPKASGVRTATLTLNHNAAGSPATYTLNCTGKPVCDVNGDGVLNLADAVTALKIVAGQTPSKISTAADMNNDGRIGIEEVLYILRNLI